MATAVAPAEQQVVKAQALIRGFLSRNGSIGARIREGKAARSSALATGCAAPPSPFLPTPHAVVSELLRAARVGPWSTVLDIGCGDARVPLAAVRDFGAERGIGVESLPEVYERAVANRDQSLSQEQQRQSVELYCADFAKEQDKAIIEDCLDRANVIFVFLLPSDMGTILRLVLQSLRRKQLRAREHAASSTGSHLPSAAAASGATSYNAAADSCPCHPSVRTRVVSWTFSLSSQSGCSTGEPLLALPAQLQATTSVALQSAHTKLHLYDLCACVLNDHQHEHGQGHAAKIARIFARNAAVADATSAIAAASSAASVVAATSSPVPRVACMPDVASIPWGHGLNSSALLRARWASAASQTAASDHAASSSASSSHGGLFVEVDLRVRPGLATTCQTTASVLGIEDIVVAHDAHEPGEPFEQWYATLLTLRQPVTAGAAASSSSGSEPPLYPPPSLPPLGLKLDFKMLAAVEPVLLFLRKQKDAVEGGGHRCRLPWVADDAAASDSDATAMKNGDVSSSSSLPLLWLNADVLPGPGFSAEELGPVVDGDEFLRLCGAHFPNAVLSLGWTTKQPPLSSAAAIANAAACGAAAAYPIAADTPDDAPTPSWRYTHAHVSAMLSLLSRHPSCAHQVTFPVRCSLVRASWETEASLLSSPSSTSSCGWSPAAAASASSSGMHALSSDNGADCRNGACFVSVSPLQRLLSSCPHSSLTVWTSRAEQSLPCARAEEHWVREHLPKKRTFVDLVFE